MAFASATGVSSGRVSYFFLFADSLVIGEDGAGMRKGHIVCVQDIDTLDICSRPSLTSRLGGLSDGQEIRGSRVY